MRVVYELDKEDIRQMIADKYNVALDKIAYTGAHDIGVITVDMSATEKPEPIQEPEETEKLPEPEPVKERSYIMDCLGWTEFMTDHDITDSQLIELVKGNIKIADVCTELSFDKRAKDRLYARVRKLRSEGALRTLLED